MHVCEFTLFSVLQHDFVNRELLCAQFMVPLFKVLEAPPPKPRTPVTELDTDDEKDERVKLITMYTLAAVTYMYSS